MQLKFDDDISRTSVQEQYSLLFFNSNQERRAKLKMFNKSLISKLPSVFDQVIDRTRFNSRRVHQNYVVDQVEKPTM